MKLFSINKNNLNPINEKSFRLEKQIQSITEKNVEKIFGWEFVKSEFSLNNLRIDSLCFDKETNAFVIIEYKNNKNFSVIDQGYSYLSLLLNNKAEFVLCYNEVKQAKFGKNHIEWNQSKVIFISPEFSTYQKEAINFKDLPIELWQFKLFQNDTLMYLPIKATNTIESIKTISSKDSMIAEVSKEIITYNEQDFLEGKPSNILEMYEALKTEILNLGNITLKPTKMYIAFKGNKNIAELVFTQHKIKVYINLKYTEIKDFDYKNKTRNVRNIGTLGNGESEFNYENIEDLDYLISLIKESYKKNK